MRYIYSIRVNKNAEHILISSAPIKKRNTIETYLKGKGYNTKKVDYEVKFIKIST